MKALLTALSLVFSVALATAQENPPAAAGSAHHATDGHVWGALIFATNDATQLTGATAQAPAGLPKLEERLAKVFPFKHFEILGQHQQDIFREYESWVVPSRDLFMKIDSKGPAAQGGAVRPAIATFVVLRTDSPLFIGGPPWKQGRLIFVLFLERK